MTLPTSFWYLQHFDVKSIQDSVDWFNFMTYVSWPSHMLYSLYSPSKGSSWYLGFPIALSRPVSSSAHEPHRNRPWIRSPLAGWRSVQQGCTWACMGSSQLYHSAMDDCVRPWLTAPTVWSIFYLVGPLVQQTKWHLQVLGRRESRPMLWHLRYP